MAFPRPALESGDALAEQVAAIVTEESVTTVVVGRPLTLRGTSGTAADAASALRQRLAAHLPANVEVTEFDERLSTVEAAGRLRAAGADARSSRSRVDSAAATVLVEAYLAAQR